MKLLIGFSLIIFGLFGVSAIPTQAQQTKARQTTSAPGLAQLQRR